MNTEAQRTAIKEACGWILTGLHESDPLYPQNMFFASDGTWIGDPLTDLNAMHAAEKVLPIEVIEQYFHHLLRICNPAFCATASQRAEAFLKTLRLWKP